MMASALCILKLFKQEMCMNEMVPTRTLAKQGVSAVGGIAGGLGLWILSGLSNIPVIGLVVGGIVTVVGLGALSSRESADKKAGMVITGAGALTVLSNIGIFAGLASGLMGFAIIGLLGMGAFNAWKFIKGLKTRG
jgi:hypothetical protein